MYFPILLQQIILTFLRVLNFFCLMLFFTQVFAEVLINILIEVFSFSLEKSACIEKLENAKVFGKII